MSARDELLAGLRAAGDAVVGDATPEELLDAFRAAVRREFAGELAGDLSGCCLECDTCIDIIIGKGGDGWPPGAGERVRPDTFPAWLYQRFSRSHSATPWAELHEGDQLWWGHEAAAVRRAVLRGGFKAEAGESRA